MIYNVLHIDWATPNPTEIIFLCMLLERSNNLCRYHEMETQFIYYILYGGGVMMFNTTFNNISVNLWWSVSLVEETRAPWDKQQPAVNHWQTSHNVVWVGFELTKLVIIGTDCTCNYKSNYHSITTMTAQQFLFLWMYTFSLFIHSSMFD
jgi:hypothetical protein